MNDVGSARDKKKDGIQDIHLLIATNLMKTLPMSCHNTTTLNFSHAHYKNKTSSTDLDREIKMGGFRLRDVKLKRDPYVSGLGRYN